MGTATGGALSGSGRPQTPGGGGEAGRGAHHEVVLSSSLSSVFTNSHLLFAHTTKTKVPGKAHRHEGKSEGQRPSPHILCRENREKKAASHGQSWPVPEKPRSAFCPGSTRPASPKTHGNLHNVLLGTARPQSPLVFPVCSLNLDSASPEGDSSRAVGLWR